MPSIFSAKKVSVAILLIVLLAAGLAFMQTDEKQQDPPADLVIPEAPLLTPTKEKETFVLEKGWDIQLVSSEPAIHHPVVGKFDEDGRLWVVNMTAYMPDVDGTGEQVPNGSISVLEDKDGDGRFETMGVFQDGLVLPRAISILNKGILYVSANQLWFVPRKGAQRSGEPVVVDKNYAVGDNPEHQPNGLMWGIDNRLYNAKSDICYQQVGDKWLKYRTVNRGQWGISQDDAGRILTNNNSLWVSMEQFAPGYMSDSKKKGPPAVEATGVGIFGIRPEPGLNRAYFRGEGWKKTVRNEPGGDWYQMAPTAVSGLAWYGARQFGENSYGDIFITEPSAHIVKRLKKKEDDKGGFTLTDAYSDHEFLASTDERFRPVNTLVGPDGALYVIDMYHGILQHKTYTTNYLRRQILSRKLDQNPGKPGRVWRIARTGQVEKNERPHMSKMTSEKLVPLLAHADQWWRLTAQRVLVLRKDVSIKDDLEQMALHGAPLGRVHALWTLSGLGLLENNLLQKVLQAENLDMQTARQAVRLCGELGNKALLTLAEGLRGKFGPQLDTWIDARYAPPALVEASAVQAPAAFITYCATCHGLNGEGLPNMGPPLARSEWVLDSKALVAAIVLRGLNPGPIEVLGESYNPPVPMPAMAKLLDNGQIAEVINYLRQNKTWGVNASAITPEEVATVRQRTEGRGPWTPAALQAERWQD